MSYKSNKMKNSRAKELKARSQPLSLQQLEKAYKKARKKKKKIGITVVKTVIKIKKSKIALF